MKYEITMTKDLTIQELATATHIASASEFAVEIEKKNQKIDCKSILGLFSLGIKTGDTITIHSTDEPVLNILYGFLRGE
jgi:phosphotransferase system HPr-like phosphotransfer protein